MTKLNLALVIVLILCALGVVTSQHRARKLYIELQKQQEISQRLDVEWGQLQLEQGTWASQARIEKLASGHLHMRVAPSSRIQVILPNSSAQARQQQ